MVRERHNNKRASVKLSLLPYILLLLLALMLWRSRKGPHSDSWNLVDKKQKNTISCPTTHFAPRTAPAARETARALWNQTYQTVRRKNLTYLPPDVLRFHRDLLEGIEAGGVPGMIVECGVAKAGSSLTLAAVKDSRRCLHLHDTFQGIPKPSAKDGEDVWKRYRAIQSGQGGGKDYYGYMKNLLEFDKQQFVDAGLDPADNAVYFHKGLFNETVWPAAPVAYAHLDGDWYDSVFGMLERLEPHLAPGAYIVLDDAQRYSGARTAFEDFFHVDTAVVRDKYNSVDSGCLVERNGVRYAVFCALRCGARVLKTNEAHAHTCERKTK